jgi:hypothetical protein
MARLFVARDQKAIEQVKWADLVVGKAVARFEEVTEDGGYWSLRAMLDFTGCDALVVGAVDYPVVEVVLGVYDAFFGWGGIYVTIGFSRDYRHLQEVLWRGARRLRRHIQWSYEQPVSPHQLGGYGFR